MIRRLVLFTLAALVSVGLASAQSATATPSAPASTVNWLFTVCDTNAVLDLNGTMEKGNDIYVQFFLESAAKGTPLSNETQVVVDGTYATSLTPTFTTRLAPGQFASVSIKIAPEGKPAEPSYSTVVDDVFDICGAPANKAVGVSGTTGTTSSSGEVAINPVTGALVNAVPGEVIGSSGILKPSSGYLNTVYATRPEPIVQIGARPSEARGADGRVTDPGLIFAECNQYPGANPGRLFDTDPITVFWSWFAKTPAQVRDHMDKAIYSVMLTEPGQTAKHFPNVEVLPIVKREDGNYWVFYVVNLGSGFPPGGYSIDYNLTWREATNDGYSDFGPGTANEALRGTCSFTIEQNPWGVQTQLRYPVIP